MSRLGRFARACRREIDTYRLVMSHPRTPVVSRLVLGAAVGYLLLPFDLIPDWIPVLGALDDLIIVPGLVWLALLMVPRGVVDECREEAIRGKAGGTA